MCPHTWHFAGLVSQAWERKIQHGWSRNAPQMTLDLLKNKYRRTMHPCVSRCQAAFLQLVDLLNTQLSSYHWLTLTLTLTRLRLEEAIVNLDKVGGGSVVNFNHPNTLTMSVSVSVTLFMYMGVYVCMCVYIFMYILCILYEYMFMICMLIYVNT